MFPQSMEYVKAVEYVVFFLEEFIIYKATSV